MFDFSRGERVRHVLRQSWGILVRGRLGMFLSEGGDVARFRFEEQNFDLGTL